MKYTLFLAAALLAPLAVAFAADEVKGMKPGDMIDKFDVVDVTGAFKKDPQVCYV